MSYKLKKFETELKDIERNYQIKNYHNQNKNTAIILNDYFLKNFDNDNSLKYQEKNEYEEDEYSELAGNKNYIKNINKNPKIKYSNKIRYSEDRNDFKKKWKTEICHYWEMNGYCQYGDNCSFAHGIEELNQRKMSHNYKTKPCKQFFELGYCTYGARCQFSHKLFDESINNLKNKKKISYLEILTNFNNSSNQINFEILKRPRLMTFENITSCTLEESEKNRIELYEDILALKIRKNEEGKESIFSFDTNDECSEYNSKIKNKCNIFNFNKENDKIKRLRFISV